MEWNLLNESSSMTNVTIICSDGIIHTHKIVVASASDFIKTLLSDIPVGDEITLYLPDHDKTSVIKLLDGVFTNDNIKHDDNQGSSIDFSSLVCEPVLLKVSSLLHILDLNFHCKNLLFMFQQLESILIFALLVCNHFCPSVTTHKVTEGQVTYCSR